MTDSEFVFLYSTFPDEASARRVAEALVRAKLAACVNIFAPMTSIYEWQGKLETAAEFAALIKTAALWWRLPSRRPVRCIPIACRVS